MACILAISTATLDLVFTLTRYPDEDAELRAYLRGLGLAEALPHACRLAGEKCGQIGLEELGGKGC